jgi:hypothetical protein
MQPEFIQFNSFILKRSEIIFIEKEKDNIIIHIRQNGEERSFIMNYSSTYSRDEEFAKLTVDMDAWSVGYEWKHPLVQNVYWVRESMREIQDEMKQLRKQFELTRKQMRLQQKDIA